MGLMFGRHKKTAYYIKAVFLIYKYYDVDYSAPPVISHGDGWVTNMLSLLVLDTDI